ncbi:MAG: putative leader peptide [Kineosporiaceae bacterium]
MEESVYPRTIRPHPIPLVRRHHVDLLRTASATCQG